MGIEITNLSYSYEDKLVLHDLNLSVKTGEQIGIIGSSGCGKSTLMKLLAGLYKPKSGFVRVDGEEKVEFIVKKVAVVMQSTYLLPGTIRENITCGHNMSEAKVQYACEAAQISAWIKTLPQGIDQDLGERANSLSGGQAQRIAIARAIAKDAPVILLDEATSALDSDTKAAVMEAINHLTQGKTVVHVTHQIELLTNCSHIYTMEDGRLYEK